MSIAETLAIKIEELFKSYQQVKALNRINLRIEKGKIFGLLGPNGSGKTTLIRTIIGSLIPDSGKIEIIGLNPVKDKMQLRKHLGYMPQLSAVYEELSAFDNIYFFGSLHKVENLSKKVEEILAFTELSDRAKDPVNTYSGGMKKRVSLACALIHNPDLLLLDEPTAAVDPHIKIQSWELFRKLTSKGVTIVVSTHLMDEAMRCDQLCILNKGEVVVVDTPQKILALGQTKMSIEKNGIKEIKTISSAPKDFIKQLHSLGLNNMIDGIELYPDTIEDIMLRLVDENSKKENTVDKLISEWNKCSSKEIIEKFNSSKYNFQNYK